ncbi:MAG: SDR family NAD(P)-dependent oxidoreductase [Parvibaculales bacterium]
MDRLKGKVAIVTGAADGMGEAITKLFADEGAQILGVDLNAEKLQNAHSGGSNSIKTLALDITEDGAENTMVDETISAFGGVDIIVNCAGIVEYENVEIMRDDNWERTNNVNLNAVFKLCRRVIPEMKKRGGGRIINIASINAYVVAPGLSAYAASKHAIVGLTKTLAVELGPDNITANHINPGAILTGMTRPLMEDAETKALFESFAVLPKMGMPEDIANGALFLASDEAAFITGTGLTIDGGFLAKV